ncbi:RuvC family protein [Acuticoccus sediminis]|uniref:hypothetical protein n=1 Tax=Acuticoccus sediminis TaxID=2184697 RepID=UPI001CFCDF04|nr:hypothetical protein [Acuticoccus sediminis]
MHLLSLDPAAKTGIARWQDGMRDPWSDVWTLDGKDIGGRANDLRVQLTRKLIAFADRGERVDAVYAEEAWVGPKTNPNTAAILHKYEVAIEMACISTKTPLRLIRSQTWRKTFFGAGRGTGSRAKQKATSIEMCRLMGWSPRDDNQADALGILYHARCTHDPEYAWRSTSLFAGRAA